MNAMRLKKKWIKSNEKINSKSKIHQKHRKREQHKKNKKVARRERYPGEGNVRSKKPKLQSTKKSTQITK